MLQTKLHHSVHASRSADQQPVTLDASDMPFEAMADQNAKRRYKRQKAVLKSQRCQKRREAAEIRESARQEARAMADLARDDEQRIQAAADAAVCQAKARTQAAIDRADALKQEGRKEAAWQKDQARAEYKASLRTAKSSLHTARAGQKAMHKAEKNGCSPEPFKSSDF